MSNSTHIQQSEHVFYGQGVMIDGECMIKTGRQGEKQSFAKELLIPYTLNEDGTCTCHQPFNFDSCSDGLTQTSTSFGNDSSLTGKWDANFYTFDINKTCPGYIEPHSNVIGPSLKSFSTPQVSFVYCCWFSPKETITSGSPEINLWDHRLEQGVSKTGMSVSISSDAGGNTGKLELVIGHNGQWNVYDTNMSTWTKDAWYHVVVLLSGSTRVYVNNTMMLTMNRLPMTPADTKAKMSYKGSGPMPLKIHSFRFYADIPGDIPIDTIVLDDFRRLKS